MPAGALAQLQGRAEAIVAIGQTQIGDDKLGDMACCGLRQGFTRVHGLPHLATPTAQQQGQRVALRQVVLDDEHEAAPQPVG